MPIARNSFVVVMVLLFLSAPVWADKWALLIGINDYPYLDVRFQLKGCENDVNLMQKVLTTKYGFPVENIKSVLSGEATKAHIVAAFKEWLIDKSKAGDVVVFYYSGHGVQIADTDEDEEDGLDEALCPTDMKPNESGTEFLNFLLDDEFNQLLSQIPTDNVTVILDCCHSGTATKDLVLVEMSQSKVIDRDLVLKHRASPGDVKPGGNRSADKLSNPNHVVMTGCRDDEVSQERTWYSPAVGYFRAGVLTKNLMDGLEQSQADVTYAHLMARVRQEIGTDAVQTPQLHGDVDRPIFSTRQPDGEVEIVEAAAKPYVSITDTTDGRLTINAGSIHGVTKGSIYAVYPPTEALFSGPGFATIQISEVALDASTATRIKRRRLVVEERTPSIAPTCRAVEIEHAFPKENLYLRIDANPDQASAFVRHLGVENVVPVPDEQRADFILRFAPELGNISVKLITAEGHIVPEVQVSEQSPEKLADKLRRTIEREVLIKLLRAFRNPNPPFDLEVWVDKRDDPTYKIGDTLSMSFKAERDCYLILLNVDSEGYVTMMFPNKYRLDNKIRGGQTYTIPSDDLLPFQIRADGSPGRELVMALATTKRLSSPIFQAENQAEIRADLTGAKLGTELIDIVSQSLREGNITNSSVSLSTHDWVTDTLIIVLTE